MTSRQSNSGPVSTFARPLDVPADKRQLYLVDDANGIYCPQSWANTRDPYVWQGIRRQDMRTIERGPYTEGYWESWDTILNNAYAVDTHGHTWRLYQDGAVWAVRDDCPFDDYGPNEDLVEEEDDTE